MIRIMIVDDMPIFLEYLRKCINWKAYGFEICCEAIDGKDAWEKIPVFCPDVVLTDITMPYINGLDLSERIIETYPGIAVVLITGNDEFEYARRAVKIGVCDYIVKPFEKEELIFTLLKLQNNIKKLTESGSGGVWKNHEIERALIYGNNNSKKMHILSTMKMSGQNFLLCGIHFYLDENEDFEQKVLWENFIIRLLCEKIQIHGQVAAFPDYENNIIVLLNFDETDELKSYKGYEFADMIQMLRAQLKADCSVTISSPGNMADIRKMYLEIMQIQPFHKAGNVWDCRNQTHDSLQFLDGNVSEVTLAYILNLKEALSKADMGRVTTVIEAMWKESKDKEKEIFASFFESSYGILMNDIIDRGYQVETIFGNEMSEENIIQKKVSGEQKKELLIQLYQQRFEYEERRARSKSYRVADAAETYIKEHYADSGLSVAEISRELLINQTYLRKMFKDEKNMTLSEYIVKYRMEKAKDLILHTDEKLAAIAEKVGYSEVSYFSNCFKKYYGISPRSIVS